MGKADLEMPKKLYAVYGLILDTIYRFRYLNPREGTETISLIAKYIL